MTLLVGSEGPGTISVHAALACRDGQATRCGHSRQWIAASVACELAARLGRGATGVVDRSSRAKTNTSRYVASCASVGCRQVAVPPFRALDMPDLLPCGFSRWGHSLRARRYLAGDEASGAACLHKVLQPPNG